MSIAAQKANTRPRKAATTTGHTPSAVAYPIRLVRNQPTVTGGTSYRVLDANGQYIATLAWMECANCYGWVCRRRDGARTAEERPAAVLSRREAFPTPSAALIVQGGFDPDHARAAVLADAFAAAEEQA